MANKVEIKAIEDMQVQLIANLDKKTNYCFTDSEQEAIRTDIMNATTMKDFEPITKRMLDNNVKICVVV